MASKKRIACLLSSYAKSWYRVRETCLWIKEGINPIWPRENVNLEVKEEMLDSVNEF